MLLKDYIEKRNSTELMTLLEKLKIPNQYEIIAIYNNDRAIRYVDASPLDFLDFAQLHAFKTLLEAELLDRTFNPLRQQN